MHNVLLSAIVHHMMHQTINLRISEEELAWIDQRALETDRTRSSVVRLAIKALRTQEKERR